MASSLFDIELDEITLARARKGDMAACETIYRMFQKPAYSVAFRICQCRELAQEVTQESFITVFRRIKQFRGDAPFWGWFRRVVVNHTITALRKTSSRRETQWQEEAVADDGMRPQVGLAMDLEAALATLSSQDRAVVWLHDVEGYNHREIGELFGKTESFSKTRLSRARNCLRELLEPAASAPLTAGARS